MNVRPNWPEGWSDAQAFDAMRSVITKQDGWRGYFGDGEDAPTDDQVVEWLNRAEEAASEAERLRAAVEPLLAAHRASPRPLYAGVIGTLRLLDAARLAAERIEEGP